MDTIKIGKFLTELRKEQGLTQEALGEKIGVTHKTVSRWENGNYLPPVEMLLSLSNLYKISINEILCGERLTEENYQEKAEETITGILSGSPFSFQERSDYWKRKWQKDNMVTNAALVILMITLLLAGIFLKEPMATVVAPAFSIVLYMVRRNDMMAYVEKHLYDSGE